MAVSNLVSPTVVLTFFTSSDNETENLIPSNEYVPGPSMVISVASMVGEPCRTMVGEPCRTTVGEPCRTTVGEPCRTTGTVTGTDRSLSLSKWPSPLPHNLFTHISRAEVTARYSLATNVLPLTVPPPLRTDAKSATAGEPNPKGSRMRKRTYSQFFFAVSFRWSTTGSPPSPRRTVSAETELKYSSAMDCTCANRSISSPKVARNDGFSLSKIGKTSLRTRLRL